MTDRRWRVAAGVLLAALVAPALYTGVRALWLALGLLFRR